MVFSTDGFNGDSADHHKLLLFLMMTASDLSDQTKNWEGTRRTAVCNFQATFHKETRDLERSNA